ncbi:MAG: hypothetical protein IJ197_04970 [Bacteroidaceae bacterium]|nr:hypothetical protein [Bacteroidaceae bacterium]
MKKLQYIQPEVEVTDIVVLSQMLAGSVTGSVDGGDGPGYGGVDDDGELDPGVKEGKYDWDW